MTERSYLIWYFVSALVASASLAQDISETPDQKRAAIERHQCSPEMAKNLLKDRGGVDFVEWEFEDLPSNIQNQVVGGPEWVMARDVHPFKTVFPLEVKDDVELQCRVFASQVPSDNDLVEYCWDFQDKAICVLTSKNAMTINLDLGDLPACLRRGAACVAAAREWVGQVVKLEGGYDDNPAQPKYRVQFPWPADLEDGVWFSSAPDQNLMRLPGMERWYSRVDAFVENGTLSIMIFKKPGQLMGYPDGSKWFDDDFRALVQSKMQQQRKRSSAP